MDIKTFQYNALQTVNYANDDIALDCTLAGLAGELGEVFELWKKFRRGDAEKAGLSDITAYQQFKQETTKELGDLLWYIVVYAWLWDIDMDTVLETNNAKLKQRQQNGTLHSSNRAEEV